MEGKHPYFEGWYFKHQSKDGETVALIPARHVGRDGRASASIQVITPAGADTIKFGGDAWRAERSPLCVSVGENRFSSQGIQVELSSKGACVRGALRYGPLSPLKSDIMGPFQFVPGLQCRHSVASMGHSLDGRLTVNGREIDFTGGRGYLEGDRGSSFPSAYLWVQCGWKEREDSGVMLSIADIPILGGHFTGCICSVLFEGREYRLATYRGVKIESWSSRGAVLRQGRLRLAVEVEPGDCHPLQAPQSGEMVRTILENIRTTARIRFWVGGKLLFERLDHGASFEYEGGDGPARQGSDTAP